MKKNYLSVFAISLVKKKKVEKEGERKRKKQGLENKRKSKIFIFLQMIGQVGYCVHYVCEGRLTESKNDLNQRYQ